MKISETAVRRPVTIIMITLLFIGLALFLIPGLAVDLFPSVDFPTVVVMTSYPNASPSVVESSVSEVLERQLSGLSGLDEMISISSQGTSLIQLSFHYGTDLDDAVSSIRDAVDRSAWQLPSEADSPTIFRFDISMIPVMQLQVQGEGYSLHELRTLAEDTIQPNLERVQHVAMVEIMGGEEQIVEVQVDMDRMMSLGITLDSIASELREADYTIDYGSLEAGGMVYNLTAERSLRDLHEIEQLVVRRVEGNGVAYPVRLGEFAEVSFAVEEGSAITRINGNEALFLTLSNESGSNPMQVSQAVQEQIAEINELLPAGAELSVLYDTTTLIQGTLDQVYRAAIQGMLLAMIVLFLFLRNIRSTVIIGLAIPISLLVTLAGMYFMGLTLNLITLTGLILALGMTVDNSIVILENIYSYRERGTKLRSSSILGTREMITAITASTLTTICVFIPLMIWKDDLGIMGQLFEDLVFTVVMALLISLITAAAVVPALTSKFIPIHTRTQYPLKNRVLRKLDGMSEAVFRAVESAYIKLLAVSLRNKALVLTLTAVVLIASFLQFAAMGLNLQPETVTDDSVSLSLTMPPGTASGRTEEILEQMKQVVEQEIEGYENIVVSVGGGMMGMGFGSGSSNTGELQVFLPPLGEQIESAAEIQRVLRPYIYQFPDAEFEFTAGRQMGTGSPIRVELLSDSLEAAEETALQVRDILIREVPQVVDPVSSQEQGGPVYDIRLEEEQLDTYSVSAQQVNHEVRKYMSGLTGGVLSTNGEDITIELKYAGYAVDSLSELRNLPIPLMSGDVIPLKAVASVDLTTGPQSIRREDQRRMISVTAGLAGGVAVTEAQSAVERALSDQLVLPDNVELSYGGEAMDIQAYGQVLLMIILVAVFMVFAVMASLFESLRDPFIIFFSIPLLVIGVVGVHVLTGQPFSLYSAVGLVVLAGIVVNNGIVLVDYTNLQMRRGVPLRRACLVAAKSRMRPILMTSLTTILSMVPLGFFPGEGMEMVQPIGQTIIGGMVVSTLMTLIVTPTIYMTIHLPKEKRRLKKQQSSGDSPVMV